MNERPNDPPPEVPAGTLIVVDGVQDAPGSVERRLIGEELVAGERLEPAKRDSVLRQQEDRGGRFGELAIEMGLITREDVLWALARQFGQPVAPAAGAGAHSEELVMLKQAFSNEVERFRDLRSQLLMTAMNRSAGGSRALAIVSSDVGDGKTFLCSNLAVAFGHLPGRTLVIDADMRSPRLHRVFGLEGGTGLSDILSRHGVSNVVRAVPGLPNLYVLPVGVVPPNPLELLQSEAFPALIAEVVSKFDHVLVDTPAAAHGSDAVVAAASVGMALIVSRRDRTRSKPLQTLVTQLGRASVRIAGLVMNDG